MKAALVTDTISIPDCLATWRQHRRQASWERPSIRKMRRNWNLSAETLASCEDRLPEEWRHDPRWRERILRNVRGQYFKRIGLDRTTFRSKPREFLRGLAYASLHEPGYLLRRLATGLTWNQQELGDEENYLRGLIKAWSVPWPPVGLGFTGSRT